MMRKKNCSITEAQARKSRGSKNYGTLCTSGVDYYGTDVSFVGVIQRF